MKFLLKKIFSSTLFLSFGNLLFAISFALIKILLIRISPFVYTEYSVIYVNYQSFQLFGLFSVNLVLLSVISDIKDEKESIKFLYNSIALVAALSTISVSVFICFLLYNHFSFTIGLLFGITYFFDNQNFLLVFYLIGKKKEKSGSFLLALIGILKAILMFISAYLFQLTLEKIGMIFFVSSLALLGIILVFYRFRFKDVMQVAYLKKIKINYIFQIVKQSFFVLVISLTYSIFIQYDYLLTVNYFGKMELLFIDPAFMLLNFIKVGLNALIQAIIVYSSFIVGRNLLKKVSIFVFFPFTVFATLYLILTEYINFDNIIFQFLFGISDKKLEQNMAILILAVAFQILYSTGLGYGQGIRKYKKLCLFSVLSLVLAVIVSFILFYFRVPHSTVIGYTIYSFFLAVFYSLFLYFNKKPSSKKEEEKEKVKY